MLPFDSLKIPTVMENRITVLEPLIIEAAQQGMDEFVDVFVDAIYQGIGGELTAANMPLLNADQTTLLAYRILRDEVMDGGFVQLIHNGYGPFIFKNPFGKMMRQWGIDELATLLNKGHRLYNRHHEAIERECSDEEFMALFEQFSDFDDLDDTFVEHEEQWTAAVAAYIDDHLDRFATILGKEQ